jgi:hypothetical protein
MKNCLSCRISKDCDFGVAVNTFKDFEDSDDGIGTVVRLAFENIERYINCTCYKDENNQ